MRFNRIFWKIFSVVWLANLLVSICVILVISSGHLRERMQNKHALQIERLAEQLITNYELGKPFQNGRSLELKKIYERLHIPHKILITITTENGEPIYTSHNHFKDHAMNKKHRPNVTIESDRGKRYIVYYFPIKPQHSIGAALRDVVSAQLFFMLLASSLLSALISWGITQPLKHLQVFSRSYRPAGPKNTLNQNLLNRGDEIGDLARDIVRMTAQVDSAFSAQENLLHDVSHELRAPLARLQVSVALAECIVPKNSTITKMHTECERMNALIQRILDYSQIQTLNQDGENIKPFYVQPLLTQVTRDIKFEFSDRPISIECSDENAQVLGEKYLLQSALENLMRNACKHTPAGRPIELSLTEYDGAWRITVRDYGQGVNEEPNNLLKPFYRAGGEMHTEGFGLGLSITARAIETLTGTLTLRNHSEGGLVATILLDKY